MNVLVINQFWPNKGDRAVLTFVLRELARSAVSEIVVSTRGRSPETGVEEYFGHPVAFVPWGWRCHSGPTRTLWQKFLAKRAWRNFNQRHFPALRSAVCSGSVRRHPPVHPEFERAMRRADVVVSTGGHHVTTLLAADGVTGQMYDQGLALLARKPLVLWSQSLGPFEFTDARNRAFFKSVLEQATEIVIRERQSEHQLQRLGVKPRHLVHTYDSVFGLNDCVPEYVPVGEREPIVGIAIYHKRRSDEERRQYVQIMADLVDHIAGRDLGIKFFPMELKGCSVDDRPLIAEIREAARHGDRSLTVDEDLPTFDHMAAVARCRVFVGHKTHSTIFALVAGTPVLAMAYHPKTEEFMSQYGLRANCVPDRELSGARLTATFDRVLEGADEYGVQQHAKSLELGAVVRRDFQAVMARLRTRIQSDVPATAQRTAQP